MGVAMGASWVQGAVLGEGVIQVAMDVYSKGTSYGIFPSPLSGDRALLVPALKHKWIVSR